MHSTHPLEPVVIDTHYHEALGCLRIMDLATTADRIEGEVRASRWHGSMIAYREAGAVLAQILPRDPLPVAMAYRDLGEMLLALGDLLPPSARPDAVPRLRSAVYRLRDHAQRRTLAQRP
jgi:hypothetical protein